MKIIVSTVDLTDGFIIDEMFENGSLNRFEKEEIEEMSKVHKTRKLVSILARNDKDKFKLDAVIKTVIPARKCLTLNIYLRI